ncbi:Phage terminase-like protein, large subunit, contains N-terminal HTH domain [Lachnospiraceae bacterium C10]|nr:Phage terminase-like protein, large subunit, contains N-terminal HTH domain [Lachnospiraceae bacterium C10]
MTCSDGEQRAEVYGCASDRQQTGIVFDVAADMVRMCSSLAKRVKINASQKRLTYLPTNSYYQVLSAEAYTKHGLNCHGGYDELHAAPDRRLFDVMTKGSGDARKQPLFFLITTAGTDTHFICYEQHMKALDILEGRKVDPTFYPVIYGADKDDDWTDPKVWKKANPSLGETIDIEKVAAACKSAQQNPAEENTFRKLRLDQWVAQAVRWMPMQSWDECAFGINEDELLGRECYGRLDLSSTSDLTAFVLVFPPRSDDEKFIERLGEKYNIREITFDRWGAVQISQDLDGMGFTVVAFGQGYKDMSPPTKELMKIVLVKRIAHGGHPVLRWCMDNVFVRTDPAGNIKMDKEKSTEKIDVAVALVMALNVRSGMKAQDQSMTSGGFSSSDVPISRNNASFPAHANIPDTVEDWLDQFNTFSIYQVLPQFVELWDLNIKTDAEAKKTSKN